MRMTASTLVLRLAAVVAVAAFAASCGSDSTGTTNKTYVANLNAAAEGAGHTSPGSGTFIFEDIGSEIDWTLDLTNMTAVTMSHIHLGDATAVGTTAGPVIFNLFIPNRATGGPLNGRIAQGTITNNNNSQVSLDSLRVLFNNGHAYANVHTTANPAGEIRDQIHPSN